MGGCASKPKDLDGRSDPLPTPATSKAKAVDTTFQQEENGGETVKEQPLIDISDPTPEVPKSEDESSKSIELKDVFEEHKPTVEPFVDAKSTDESNSEEAPKEDEKEIIANRVTKETEDIIDKN